MDRASLQWVQEDVEQSLRQAQINLEAYLDSPDDGHMLECAETLHGVRGVLEMLEVYGVSLLLDEVGQLCKAVHEGEIARRSDACEVLMQAIVQVPDYLDFITRGNPDNAMIVMPLLNDVRSVRGMALLSENSLFAPDLDAKLPFKQRPVALQGPSFVAYVKKLRPHYQKGLVAWYRGESTDAVNIIEAVVAHVQKLVGSSSVARLWLVARAIIDALKSGGLEESVSIKLLIGQLDRQLRRYMRDGHSATEELGAPQLLKNLLYYCARSSPGTQRLEVVRSVYGLTELLGPGGGSGVSTSEILGPNLQTVATVTGELQESLARARDNLDVYTRKDLADRTRADLEAVEALISQVADTLGLLSLGVPRKALVELGEVLKGYIEQNIRPNDAQLMDVATVILRVNGALNSAASKGIDGLSRDGNYIPHSSEETQLTGIEYLQLATSVIGEAKSDIAVIKETIATYIAERQRSVRLDEVPARVAQVAGGIRMLFLEPCADLLERWIGYVEKVLLHAHDIPEDAVLERIADGIESIDYYLEAVVGAFGADADVRLAHATACVEALPELDETEAVFSPYNSARPSEEEAYATVATGPGEFLGHTREDGARRDLPTEHNRAATGSAQEPPDFVDAVGTSDGPGSLGDESINSGPAADTVEILEIESVEEITVMGIAGQTVDFGAHDSTAFDTIDAGPEAPSVDAVEEPIKIEEVEIAAAHSSEEVAAEAAAWEVGEHDEIVVVFDDQADPDLDGEANFAGVEVTLEDESAVRAVAEPAARGDDEVALRFGPLATDARESPPGDAVDDDAPAPMPWSVEESLMKARDLLDRMDRHDAQIAAESESADGQEPETAPAGGLLRSSLLDDGIDDEIIDIFLEEGDDVLAMFDEFLPKWLANPADGALLGEIRRGYHTLKGSGRLVGAVTIGEFCWCIEDLLNRMTDGVVAPTEPVMKLMQEATASLPSMFAELRGDGPSGVDVEAVRRRALELSEAAAGPALPARVRRPPEKPVLGGGGGPANGGGGGAVAVAGAVVTNASAPSTGAEILEFPLRREPPGPLSALLPTEDDKAATRRVFLDEAGAHLRAIAALLSSDSSSPHAYVRPMHALRGAARTAGLAGVAKVCDSAENLLHGLITVDAPLDSRAADFIAQVRARAATAIESYVDTGLGPLEGADELAESGRKLAEQLAEEAPSRQLGGGKSRADGAIAERMELREAFLEEAGEILDVYESVMERWRDEGPTKRLLDELQRALHTLKGGARMAQLKPIGDLSHSLESVISLAVDGRLEVSADVFEVVESAQDRLADMLDCVVAHQHLDSADDLIEVIEALASGQPLPARTRLDEADLSGEEEAEDAIPVERGERIQVDSELLDNLASYAGELGISKSRIELQVGLLRNNLGEMSDTVRRLREQLRRLEMETESQILYRHERDGHSENEGFDPLEFDRFSRMQELSRGLAESVDDLNNIHDDLTGISRESERTLVQQGRTNTDLQRGLTQTRMLPFSRLVPRFRRVVRQTAREVGKQVRLRVSGDDLRIDRAILNRIVGALEHVLRNSVDHGIETPYQRTEAGKCGEGTIRLDVTRDGREVVVHVSDDGVGVQVPAVRERAIERGLMNHDSLLSDDDVLQFIFEPAFSTRATVTQISGRGVGLDVVQSEVKQLGGMVGVATEAGSGSRFEIRLPLTLAIN